MRERVRRGFDRMARFAIARRGALATGVAIFVVAAVAFRWARRSAGFWSIDDAGITYAAAFEYVDRGTLAAYVEGTPVERYSNPVVFFAVALLRWLGLFDPVASHLRVEMVVFAIMVVLVWSLLRRVADSEVGAVTGAALFTTFQLSATPTWIWYGSGLENVWVSAGLVAMLWLCVRTARGVPLAPAWGAVAFLAAITRPEAPVYVAGFYAALAVFARPPELPLRGHVRQVAMALAVTAVLYAAFLLWRRACFGDWLPNTYYAKVFGENNLGRNLRASVFAGIVLRAPAVAASAIPLLLVPRTRRIAAAVLVLQAASLALPFTVGEDWGMGGGNRFSTPYLAMSHAAFAALAAVCIAGVRAAPRRAGRAAAAIGLVVVAVLAYRFVHARIRRPMPRLNEVTIGRIGATQGGVRWEHQMRVGVPFGVVMLPDAGGSMLVGGMQMLDNAYLADFVMAHMGRYTGGDPALLRQVNQYQHEERRPDIVDGATAIGAIDTSYLGTRYLPGHDHLHARSDLVTAPAVDADARLLVDDGALRIYLSGETVALGAPGALVRCELIVAWTDAAAIEAAVIRGAIAGGDRDEISLRPYRAGPSGVERRALLLGAPDRTGPAIATIELVRGDRAIGRAEVALDVRSRDALATAAAQLAGAGSPMQAARRLAWLREQSIPRLGMTAFHRVLGQLFARDARHGSLAGESLMQLRWNARLAALGPRSRENQDDRREREALEPPPAALRTAEDAVAQRLLATCPAADPAAPSLRVACLGRAIDELRRLGYLGVLDRAAPVAAELARARDALGPLPPGERYRALVGLTLADPSDVPLQRQLIALRRALDRYPPLPAVTDR